MNQRMNARTADCQQDQRAEALVEQIGKAMLEHYKMELSKKVTHTKKQKALTCRFNGGSVPYGYQIDDEKHYQINPDQTPWYRISSGVLPLVSPWRSCLGTWRPRVSAMQRVIATPARR